MSKYTTELRYVCEHYAGLENSMGYSNINDVIEQSRKWVFNFKYPIFDEAYRPVLETKILKHFYLREIGTETVGEWKLLLDMKMNEIMPYYNQLYESTLVEFHPLWDTDYTFTSNKKGTENRLGKTVTDGTHHTVTEDQRVLNTAGQTDTSTSGTQNSTTGSDVTGKVSETGEATRDATTTTDRDYGSDTTTQYRENTSDDLTSKTEGLVDFDSDTQTDNWKKGDATNNVLHVSDELGSTDSETKTKDETNTTGSDMKWQYYHDTPQGSLTNIDNATYLTNATKNTDSVTNNVIGTGNTQTSAGDHKHLDGSDTTTSDNHEEGGDKVHQFDNTMSTEDVTSGRVVDTSKDGTDNVIGTEDVSVTENSTHGGSKTTDKTEHVSGTGEVTNSGTQNVTSKGGEEENKNGTANTTDNVTANSEDQATTIDEYISHVNGKRGLQSFSKMLQEFRESFLNVDMMVIGQLEELFMGLW